MLPFLQNLLGLTKEKETEKTGIETEKTDGYLKKLFDNLEKMKNDNQRVSVTIKEVKPEGFVIKAGGVFGFIFFKYMPWKYNHREDWISVAPYLIGKSFFCEIYSIKSTKPFSLIVNGNAHKFHSIELEENTPYNCIVIQKANYGLFLEIGYHFNWKYGSLVGLAHKSTFTDIDAYNNIKIGDIITTNFQGLTDENKIILGDTKVAPFSPSKFNKYLGTVVEVTIKKPIDSKKKYFVDGEFPAMLSVTKVIYPEDKNEVKDIVANFKDNEKIFCLMIGVSNKHRKIQLKLIDIEAYKM